MRKHLSIVCAVLAFASFGCPKEEKKTGDVPPPPTGAPPPSASSTAGACASGGGPLTDAISAPFFSRSIAGYCVDPQGEIKTYGDKGKSSMDEVCTTAFDGECEVYKSFGLKRVVSLHYVDGSGKGGSVEVNLSEFANEDGAYGMYTLRVVAGDPAEPSTPKPLDAVAAGAAGTGRAYVWRGKHLVELQYVNEQESPAELAKSSATILGTLGKDIGKKLPGAPTLPPAAQALPTDKRIPNGIVYQPKDVFGFKGIGPGATGFYKDGDRRWRVVSIVKEDVDRAKDVMKTLRGTPGTLPVTVASADESLHVVAPKSTKEESPKVELLVSRKGAVVWAIADDEYALRGDQKEKARITKEEAVTKMSPLLAQPSAPSLASSAAPKGSSLIAPASSAPSHP